MCVCARRRNKIEITRQIKVGESVNQSGVRESHHLIIMPETQISYNLSTVHFFIYFLFIFFLLLSMVVLYHPMRFPSGK